MQATLHARPWLTDAVVAAFVGLLGLISSPTVSFATASQIIYTLIVLGCCVAMLFRRRHPHAALAAMALLLLGHLTLVDEIGVFAGVVCLIAADTTQTRLTPPCRWVCLAVVYAGAATAILLSSAPAIGEDWHARAIVLVAVLAALTVAALAGVVRRHARARYEAAIERAAILEAQQDTERRLAGVEERNRIAREMHDVLGHSLNAVAVQAEGARYVLRTDPEQADRALATIGQLSRSAVDEVRELIDVLRTEDEAASTRPAPSLRDVPDLIGTVRHTGTTIRLRSEGDIETVPGHVSLTAYRIVQESLTNAIRHAEHATTMIHITVGTRSVDLVTANGGPIRAATMADTGHGIIGMRERAHALGGTLDAGPDPATGGWRVHAHLPWSRP